MTPAPTTATHTITGTFELDTDQIETVGSFGSTTCRGLRGFADIRDGAPVVVRNEADIIIAKSELANSKRARTCVFTFDIPAVPDATFYSIEVSDRGLVTYSKAEMDSMGWNVALNLRE